MGQPVDQGTRSACSIFSRQPTRQRVKLFIHPGSRSQGSGARSREAASIVFRYAPAIPRFIDQARHRHATVGDRAYQQDQVAILTHPRISGCVLGVLADGMGGKSGVAADQVVLTAQQLFERFSPRTRTPGTAAPDGPQSRT